MPGEQAGLGVRRSAIGFQLAETPAIVFLNTELLYSSSEYGNRVLRERTRAEEFFREQNSEFATLLQEEESWLRDLRTSGVVDEAEFEILSDHFNRKVNLRRQRQDSIPDLLLQWIEQSQGEFDLIVSRFLPEIVRRERFRAVFNATSAEFYPPELDITPLILNEINLGLGDGTNSSNYEPPEQFVRRNAPAI